MPPSSLLIAVDMESFTALRIEPHLITAAVYLHLHLFGCHIHVHIDHFPRCYQLKSLLEKFRILHATGVFAISNRTICSITFVPKKIASLSVVEVKISFIMIILLDVDWF